MGLRGFIIFAALAVTTVALAHEPRPRVEGRVHDGQVCWDPDVEFPVPCDDDDD